MFLVIIFTFALNPFLYAEEFKPYVGSKEFEQLKKLNGHWSGTIDMGKGPEKVKASYKVTSGGSALIETIFEGMPHEMITVYHDDNHRKLNMTHYCMLNNQPKMTLASSSGNSFQFFLADDSNIQAAHEDHMHSALIKIEGKNKMTQHWTEFDKGKKKKVVKIVFNRVK